MSDEETNLHERFPGKKFGDAYTAGGDPRSPGDTSVRPARTLRRSQQRAVWPQSALRARGERYLPRGLGAAQGGEGRLRMADGPGGRTGRKGGESRTRQGPPAPNFHTSWGTPAVNAQLVQTLPAPLGIRED